VSGLKPFNTKSGVTEVAPRLAEVESDVQDLIEAHMETMLGVRFLVRGFLGVHDGRFGFGGWCGGLVSVEEVVGVEFGEGG
jgi:hypothetical protein